MADRGVPDWRDASAYPDPKLTTVRRWWWEFTRRRPDYRELWDGANEAEGRLYRLAPDVDAFRLEFELSVIPDPACRFTDWQLMHFHHPRNFAQSPREQLREQDAHERLLEQAGHPHVDLVLAADAHRGQLAEDEGHVLLNFDLSRSLAPQLEKAEHYLRTVQKELFGKVGTRRPRPDNWREFLRAIDARDAGATFREIRDVFWPHLAEHSDGKKGKTEQSGRDIYLAACNLRNNFAL